MATTKRKICIVTGSRAEYGLLYWLMKEIQQDADFELQVVATGMHLSPEFGLTYQQIEQDGFVLNEKVAMLLSSDTSVGIAKSIGLGTIGFADAYARLMPDLVIVLGDRFEILAAAQAALVAKLPLAHLFGGDITEGAYDESIRHSLTKMAHLHFVSNDDSARRVRQLGEDPKHVYNVGATGLDQIKRLKLLDAKELEKQLDFKFRKKNLLITFHPATLDDAQPADQMRELLAALTQLGDDVGLVFTMPNADSHGRELIRIVEDFVKGKANARAFTSLGQLRYLSLMAKMSAVVGNSSSGLYEAPSFAVPTVNIGSRQKGRLQSNSVLNCEPTAKAIVNAIQQAFGLDCSKVVNHYGDGDASIKIVKILKTIPDFKVLLQKHFFDVK
jgi:UDP-hydrolysing UDP-N-acetyl-D-glucosamine 2-epimerase